MEKKTMWILFSVCANGKISKLEAIFRPPLTKKYKTLLSIHHGRMKIVTDEK